MSTPSTTRRTATHGNFGHAKGWDDRCPTCVAQMTQRSAQHVDASRNTTSRLMRERRSVR